MQTIKTEITNYAFPREVAIRDVQNTFLKFGSVSVRF